MDMRYLVILLAIACVREISCLQCRVCKNVEFLEECDTLITCQPGESCYTDEKIVGNQVLYEAGCRDKAVCAAAGRRRSVSKRDSTALVACSRCCSRNETRTPTETIHCNDRLCGLRRSFSNVKECYSCDDVSDINECNTVKSCQRDEVCSVEQTNDFNNFVRYTMGCKRTHPCIEVTQFGMEHEDLLHNPFGKRSGLKGCSVCCGGTLCNTGGCFPLLDKLRRLWKAGSLDNTTLTYIPPTTGR